MHIIYESVLMLHTKIIKIISPCLLTIACQSWRVFFRHSVNT